LNPSAPKQGIGFINYTAINLYVTIYYQEKKQEEMDEKGPGIQP
jgi:hypothetical protein